MTVATTATNAQMQALRLMRELRARDGWSREQLVDLQRERLRALVRAAVTNSAYYREALGPAAAGGEVLLEELPTLPKETLLDEFDRIVTDPRLRLDDLEAHAAGPDPARSYLDRYRVFSTSGTTGLRGLTVFTEAEFAVWVAANLRALTRIGITPGTRLAAIGAPSPLHLTRQLFAAFQAGRAGAPRLSVLTPLAETLTALNGYLPEALIGYPSIAGLLAQEQLDGRLAIAPRFVGVGGEVLTAETKAAIREAWGVEPADVYAATEAPIIASSIPGQPGLWIAEDLVVVEVVDEASRPVPPGTPGFKVLVTNLVNHAQPLIRYELSDSAVLADDTGPGALPYGRITRVDGRSDDILRFPAAGGGGEVAVHPYRLRAPVAELREVRQYQIVRDDSGLCVRLVLQPSAPRETTGRVWEAILAALHAAGAAPPPVRVTPVHEIPREPGHAAKLKLIVDARAAEHAR